MLSEKRIDELREILESSKSPLFLYDNDADGLCSFLILRRYLGRGKGVAVRSYPDLNKEYVRKARELNADSVFILDKPVISKEFVSEIENMNLPLIWVDHHNLENDFKENENFHIFNWGKEGSEPVSYLAYLLTKRKEDIWIAMMGCISDHFLPDFKKEFEKEYPDLWKKEVKKPFDAYFNTEIGRIALALNFGLMDTLTNIVQLQNFLIKCTSPNEVFGEVKENKAFRENYIRIKKKYDALIEKALESDDGNMIFFEYSGDLSISSEIANELYHRAGKYIVVVYKKGAICNISIRGNNVKLKLEKVLKRLENATGGGHTDAVGARIKLDDLEKFKEMIKEEIQNG